MSLCRVTLILCLPFATVSCQTERTVLSGPTVTGLDENRSGDIKGRGQDPSGYTQNATGGLNAMSEQMYGGKLNDQTTREFQTNQKFLTREYGKDKEFATKSSTEGGKKSGKWTDKLFETDNASEGQPSAREGGRDFATQADREAGKTARTGDYAEGSRQARTSNYLPAERALADGRDAPKRTSAQGSTLNTRDKEIRDRIANSNATASEVNQFLGKP